MSHDESVEPLREDELTAQEGELLPPREEMSLIDPDAAGGGLFLGGPEPPDATIQPVE